MYVCLFFFCFSMHVCVCFFFFFLNIVFIYIVVFVLIYLVSVQWWCKNLVLRLISAIWYKSLSGFMCASAKF